MVSIDDLDEALMSPAVAVVEGTLLGLFDYIVLLTFEVLGQNDVESIRCGL